MINNIRYEIRDGKKYKITTIKKKVYNVVKERRKTWKKFGDAATMGNEGITIVGDPIYMEFLDEKTNTFKRSTDIFIKKKTKKYKYDPKLETINKKSEIQKKKGKRTLADIEKLFKNKHLEEKRTYKNDDRKIIIFNLDKNLEEEDIRYEFEKYGRIRYFKRLPNKHIAFITYYNEHEALDAIKSMDGKPLGFTILNVKKASKKK